MKKPYLTPQALATALLLMLASLLSQAQAQQRPVTRTSAIQRLDSLKQYHSIPHFRLGGSYHLGDHNSYAQGGLGGITLESRGAGPLKVGYIAVGTPRRNPAGEIINAVVVSPHYSGDATVLYDTWYAGQPGNVAAGSALIGPGQLIDTSQFYVIFLDAVGLWGSSKPSEGLGPDFPEYSILDMVQANYRLLKDKLKVGQVLLAMGPSMGGMQSYAWAVLHPEWVQAILPIGGTGGTQHDPIVRDLFQLMSAAIESDPSWRSTQGRYYDLPKAQHPNQGVAFGWSLLAHTGTSLDYQYAQGWEQKKTNTFSWSSAELGQGLHQKSQDYDANDLLYRNRALFSYDIMAALPGITARSLILHIENDQWILLENARRAAAAIPGAQVLSFADPLAHYAIFKAPHHFSGPVAEFVNGQTHNQTP